MASKTPSIKPPSPLIDARLIPTQRNALVLSVSKHQFTTTEFSIDEVETEELEPPYFIHKDRCLSTRVFHNSTGYYFTFGRYSTMRYPGTTRTVAEDNHKDNWQTKIAKFDTWLQTLRHEVDAPDLWAIAEQGKALSEAASQDTENLPFTPSEIKKVNEKLDELKQLLLGGQQFQEREAAIIDNQFRYLKEASERLGRKDWLTILYGVLIPLAIQIALPPERANSLIQMASTMFNAFVHHAQGLL